MRINRDQINKIIDYERTLYFESKKVYKKDKKLKTERFYIFKYQSLMRKCEYYFSKKTFLCRFFYRICAIRMNKLGIKVNIHIPLFSSGRGLVIHHCNVLINAKIGENCIFHGNNCLGNNTVGGHSEFDIPLIGNNVDFGFGSVVIGSVTVANDVKLGANAVLTKSIMNHGEVWAGVPAKRIK